MNNYSILLKDLALKNSSLFWDIKEDNLKNLSEEAILERLLTYGDMSIFYSITKDIKSFEYIYRKIRDKNRSNLQPIVINYTDLFLKKYA